MTMSSLWYAYTMTMQLGHAWMSTSSLGDVTAYQACSSWKHGCWMQYTLILCASKRMPKQCLDYLTGHSRSRRTVGVRMPGDPICQVVTCSSVPSPADLPLMCIRCDAFPRTLECCLVEQASAIMKEACCDAFHSRSQVPLCWVSLKYRPLKCMP